MKLYKLTLTILLIVTFSFNVKAQNINSFYYEANVANDLAKAGKIDSAIIVYEAAFEIIDYVPITYLNKIVILAKQNKDKERIKNYSKQIKTQKKGTSPQLKSIIDSLHKADQKVRTGMSARKARYFLKCDQNPNCNKQSKRYIKSKRLSDNWKKTDSLNNYFLLELFKQHGFIGEELVGFKRYLSVIAILSHFDEDSTNKILKPALTRALNKGKIWPIHYAQILDRHLGGKYTVQKYWMWPIVSKTKLPFTETEITQIMELRESIGVYGSELWQEHKGNNWILRNKRIY